MIHRAIPEYGRLPIGGSGFSRSHADALLRSARAHPLRQGDAANILFERNRNLHAAQMVGVLAAPDCSLEILPKVDPEAPDEEAETVRSRLVEMIDVALDLKIGAGEAADLARGAPSLLDILIRIFADRLIAETRRGLPRAYLPHEDDLPSLRGRLDLRRQFTALAVQPHRLACRFDVLSPDTPILRLMKNCVLRLIPYARRFTTRRLLDELRIVLADVSLPRHAGRETIVLDRTNSRWRALVSLARLLLGGDWQDVRASAAAARGISLLFPMNDLFESYVAALARRALAPHGLEVSAQGGGAFCLADWREGEPETPGNLFGTRPDLIIRRRGRPVAIVDTKWKAIGRNVGDRKHGVSQSDIYQMMAYAQLYRVDRLMLLYPHHGRLVGDSILARHRIAVSRGARLEIGTVDVSAGRALCQEALGRLLVPMAAASVGEEKSV